jgi:GDP-L-fucose synthase
MDRTAKIYVAGHKGLVGSALVRKLKERGYDNLILRDSKELDLRKQKDVEDFFGKEKPEFVFLAAARVGGILANSTYKAEFIYDNLMIAANIVNFSYKYGVKKLLNLGSSCIYPKHCQQPMKEEYLLSGKLEPTNEPYAVAKIAAIKLCRYYNEQYEANFISVMPTNLYGSNDNFDLKDSHVLAAFMRKFYLAKLLNEEKYNLLLNDLKYHGDIAADMAEGEIETFLTDIGIFKDSIKLWGSGKPYREFLYVDDLANACLFLMQNYDFKDIGEFINIGTGKDLKIEELAQLIKNIVGYPGRIEWDKTKPDGTPQKLLDVSRINNLGWKATISLDEGIKKTYDWYLKKEVRG